MSNHHTPIINYTVSVDQLIGNATDARMAFVILVMHPAGGGTVDITVQNSHNPRLNLTKTLFFIADAFFNSTALVVESTQLVDSYDS